MNEIVNSANATENEPNSKPSRPLFETLIFRALRLRCPKCGVGKMYRSFAKMNNRCSNCDLRIARPGGYYLGSVYVNYGITAATMTVIFLTLRVGFQIPMKTIIWPLFAFCLIFPVLFFHHARALWLAIDCQIDRSVMDDDG